MMKVVVGLFGALLLLFLLVGVILPRDWKVEVTTPTNATAAQVLPLVRDFRQWSSWTAPIPDATYTYSDQQGLSGSWMAWKAPTSRAKFILTELSERGVKFDEMMESDAVNAHGELLVADGTLVWRDNGTLPPVIGGYFRGLMERALAEHMTKSLERLNSQAQSAAVADAPRTGDGALAADAGSDAKSAQLTDAGAEAKSATIVDAGVAGRSDAQSDAGADALSDAGSGS